MQVAVAGLGVATTVAIASFVPPTGSGSLRSFDSDRVARLEVDMWRAYYAKQRVRLFGLLIVTLREQYHFSWATATRTAFLLARAATTFGDAKGNYGQVLPDLTSAFTIIRSHSTESFDPAAVARAELAWWVARRVPGENSVDQVGRLIAEAYGAMYGASTADMLESGTLRARAAALRDGQAARPDWTSIEQLVTLSYRTLHQQLQTIR